MDPLANIHKIHEPLTDTSLSLPYALFYNFPYKEGAKTIDPNGSAC